MASEETANIEQEAKFKIDALMREMLQRRFWLMWLLAFCFHRHVNEEAARAVRNEGKSTEERKSNPFVYNLR